MVKARLKQDDLDVFDSVRKRVQLDLQQYLTIQPLEFKNADVRATLELDLVKRPWNKAKTIFTGVNERMCQTASGLF